MSDKNKKSHASQFKYLWIGLLFIVWASFSGSVLAAVMKDILIDFDSDDKTQIAFEFDTEAAVPKSFMMYDPNRLILDFKNIKLRMSKDKVNQKFQTGLFQELNVMESDGRLRVNLSSKMEINYQLKSQGNRLILDAKPAKEKGLEINQMKKTVNVNNIDFRRGEFGEARLILRFDQKDIPIDLNENGGALKVTVYNGLLPKSLQNIYDVTDFATPVHQFQAQQNGSNVEVDVLYDLKTEKIAYQMENEYIIELIDADSAVKKNLKPNTEYIGERLSLNFQDIEIRAVLQILSDFTGINMVTSDKVYGKLTLRLNNVPWDQALDMVIRTKGLAKRQMGNVMMIGTIEDIAANEQAELKVAQKSVELTPLLSELMQINYAKADDVSKILKNKENSILSGRGNVSIDARTNTLLVQDTAKRLSEIKDIVQKIDIPTKQVEIEAQIVTTTINMAEAMGFRWAGAGMMNLGQRGVAIGSDVGRTNTMHTFMGDYARNGQHAVPEEYIKVDKDKAEYKFLRKGGMGDAGGFGAPAWEGYLADLGIKGSTNLAFSFFKLPKGTLLDLELQAQENENKTKVLAKPKLRTMDQQAAVIEAGQQIPYPSSSASGGTTTQFVAAVLKLDVTPQILPNENIFLEVNIQNDTPGTSSGTGAPPINTQSMRTKVLLANGETIVLGGIKQNNISDNQTRVPFLSSLPIIGRLFKNKNYGDITTDLVVFITPRIVKTGL